MSTLHDTRRRLITRGRITAGRTMLWALARSGDLLSEFLRPGAPDDVYALYERMRASGPVHRSRTGAFVVTSHALCGEVLRDPRYRVRDLNDRPADYDRLTNGTDDGPLTRSFVEQDPPDHTRLRRLAAPAFRPRLVRGYRERIAAVAGDLLDRAARQGSFDLVADLAAPLPITVISELLGVPDVDVDRFARIGTVVGQSLGGVFTARQAEELRAASAALRELFTRLMRERRERPGGDDVLSILTAAEVDGQLDVDELVAACALLLIAGFETTVNLIGNAAVALARHPEQWALLRAEPDRAAAVVEETLRWDPSVQATVRVTHETVELDGRTLAPGSRVVLLLGAANRDPAAFRDPQRFDSTRTGEPDHLSFAAGIHYCLGAPLARLEGEVAIRAMAERWPELRVTGPLRRRPGSAIRGYAAIPMGTPHLPVGP